MNKWLNRHWLTLVLGFWLGMGMASMFKFVGIILDWEHMFGSNLFSWWVILPVGGLCGSLTCYLYTQIPDP